MRDASPGVWGPDTRRAAVTVTFDNQGEAADRRPAAPCAPQGGRPAPHGVWELKLSDTVRDRFDREEIEDIMFVVTHSGRAPEWPP